MKIVLRVFRKNETITNKFDTVSEAYKYYLKNYSTVGDWVRYLAVAHKLLNNVSNEGIMGCIFRHTFKNACIAEDRG